MDTNEDGYMEEQKQRILIADDEELSVKFLQAFLSRKGFEVSAIDRGDLVIERIEHFKPDLILLDAMMPGMDGFDICRYIRSNSETNLLPIIMITALHSVEDEVRALEAGADDFLPKPINNVELMARLRSLLRMKVLHDQLAQSKKELEKKNHQLVELQGLRDSLSQMIVHDLKNPLMGIMGCVELLMTISENLSDKQQLVISKINDGASTILNMITDMLDISRMEENKVKLNRERFHISEIFEANKNEFAYLLEKNNLCCVLEIAKDVPAIEADKDLIHRVVTNLLHNAIKHSTKNNQVTLKANYHSDHQRLCIVVKDCGEGIPVEYKDKIFEKFAQADLKKLGLKTDRGLGLTFCKLAIEAHGGKIWVDSKVGEGSEFIFYLPVADLAKVECPK